MSNKEKYILSAKNLSFRYNKNLDYVINNFTFDFKCGTMYAILGKNGSGKTTLLECMNGLHKLSNGAISININGQSTNINAMNATQRAKVMSFLPQFNTRNSLNVYENILLGRKPYFHFRPSKSDHCMIQKTIKEFDLNKDAFSLTKNLSGGEFQRVCIARAYVQNSPILLVDEPTNNLDVGYQREIFSTIKSLSEKSNKCVICVIHDINIAIKYADQIIIMKNGEIYKSGDSSIIDKKTIDSTYECSSHIFTENNQKFVIIE